MLTRPRPALALPPTGISASHSRVRRCIVVLAASALSLSPAAQSAPRGAERGVTDKEVVIGQTITLQGGKNAYGVDVQQGMKLCLDQVNAAGGVNGRRIVVKVLDDENRAATAAANARTLVDDGVFMLFGSIEGGPSTAVMQVAVERQVPFFGPLAGAPTLRRPYQEWVFPVRAEHRDEFRALMSWGKSVGMRTVGFLQAEGPNGNEHLANVKLIAQELGMQVVLAVPLKADAADIDLDRMALQIQQVAPDLFFNHGSAGLYARLITKTLRTPIKTRFLGVNSGSTQLARSLGPLAHGMVFSQVVPSPWERKHAIAREYQDAARRANPNALFSYGGMEGFLTAKALVAALKASGRDLSRASFVRTLNGSTFDLGGVKVRYTAGEHTGSQFVDLSIVDRHGRFVH